MSIWLKKFKFVSASKSKAKELRHFKANPVLNIDANFDSSLDLCEYSGLFQVWRSKHGGYQGSEGSISKCRLEQTVPDDA